MTWQTNFTCDVCGKNRGRQFNHVECNKIRQQNSPKRYQKSPKAYSNKNINKLLKLMGE